MKYQRKIIDETLKNKILELYQENYSLSQIEKLVNINRHKLSFLLHDNNYEIRKPEFYRRFRTYTTEQRKQMSKKFSKINKGRISINKLSIVKAIFNYHKSSAKRRNKVFELSEKTIKNLIFKNCYYCNSKPSRKFRYRDVLINGIDRLNPKLGYIKDNCVPCCNMCNIMKNDYTEKEFKDQIKLIYKEDEP